MRVRPDAGRNDLHSALQNRCIETVVAESIVSGCFIITGIVSNLLICTAIYRNVRLRNTIHMYIFSYVIIDLIKSVLVMPLTFGALLKGEWFATTSVCQFQGYVTSVLNNATILTMTITAIDRFVANIHLAHYLTFHRRKYVCGALAISWLVSFAAPLALTISGDDFVFHPGYGICREEVTGNKNYLRSSILKIVFVVFPFIVISACYFRVVVNMQKTYKMAKLRRGQEEHILNIMAWRGEEDTTRFLAALILGTVIFWVPTYVCDIVDTYTHKYCLPRSVYLLSTLIVNASCSVKTLIVAFMDVDFRREFNSTLKWRKARRVIDINVAGKTEARDLAARLTAELLAENEKYRMYHGYVEEKDDIKTVESTV